MLISDFQPDTGNYANVAHVQETNRPLGFKMAGKRDPTCAKAPTLHTTCSQLMLRSHLLLNIL
jgi:hypothetical protein